MEYLIFFTIIFFISLSQAFLGVGILVLGTPLFLILNFQMIDIIAFLLPISIFSSFLNIIFIKCFNETKSKIKFENKNLKYFFLICIPAIFIGIKILEKFNTNINFNILVALVIFFSIIFKKFFIQEKWKNNHKKKIFTFLMGIVHGLTNSGGAILLLSVSNLNKKRDEIRYEISFFYFLLALFQYAIFLGIFGFRLDNQDFLQISIIIIFINMFIGNFLSKKISLEIFKKLINFFTIFFAIGLLIKNFFSA